MAGTEQTRAVVQRYLETMTGRDWDAFSTVIAEDVVYELPQTNERITGRDKYVQFNREYPGDWVLTVTRLLVDGSAAAASMNFTVGDEEMVGLVYLQVSDGLVSRVTDFWPEPYEPPTRREHLVDRVPSELDRFIAT